MHDSITTSPLSGVTNPTNPPLPQEINRAEERINKLDYGEEGIVP